MRLSQAAGGAAGDGTRQASMEAGAPPVAVHDPLEARLEDLLRIIGKALSGDFQELPSLDVEDDAFGRFSIGLRFLLDDLRRARQARDEELERLRRADEAQRRLVNAAAHELATPLTPLHMQVSLLRDALKDGPLAPRVAIIDRSVQRMVRLTQDLLDTCRLQNGQLPLRLAHMDAAAVVAQVCAGLGPLAAQGDVRLDVSAPGPAMVHADADRLAQVVENLVHNAIKFTPPGGSVTVLLDVVAGRVRLEVTDTGPGLEPEEVLRLFEPFSRPIDDRPGTGLGLSICKGLVRRHGGTIRCDSPGRGHGCTFTVTLPARDAAAPPSAPRPRASARRSGAGCP